MQDGVVLFLWASIGGVTPGKYLKFCTQNLNWDGVWASKFSYFLSENSIFWCSPILVVDALLNNCTLSLPLLFIIMCALIGMLLIKAIYLLTYLPDKVWSPGG